MHDRDGARQPKRFDPARAARLDDPGRFAYLEPGAVVALLDAPRGGTVIDFGAGTGTYALEIALRRPDLHVIAFDEQAEMLDYLRAKPGASERVEILDPAGIGVWRGRAERIVAINVFHELGDAALVSLGTLLAPGGRALFIDWNAAVERPVGPPADHLYGPKEARERLAAFGFAAEAEAGFPYHYAVRVSRTGDGSG